RVASPNSCVRSIASAPIRGSKNFPAARSESGAWQRPRTEHSITASPSTGSSQHSDYPVLGVSRFERHSSGYRAVTLDEPYKRRVVRVGNELHGYTARNVDRSVMVNAIRVVGHLDNGVRRGIEHTVASI